MRDFPIATSFVPASRTAPPTDKRRLLLATRTNPKKLIRVCASDPQSASTEAVGSETRGRRSAPDRCNPSRRNLIIAGSVSPCKAWPSATASGGTGLTRAYAPGSRATAHSMEASGCIATRCRLASMPNSEPPCRDDSSATPHVRPSTAGKAGSIRCHPTTEKRAGAHFSLDRKRPIQGPPDCRRHYPSVAWASGPRPQATENKPEN
jgi:hypothetical protein